MADPRFLEAWGYTGITIGSTNVIAGDALYFDGTDWELADADDNTKFAELFAAESYDTGARGVGVVGGILADTDAPYTQNDKMYLSETAGAMTATRPTTENSLTQILGFALSTSQLNVRIKIPEEYSFWVDLPHKIANAAITQDADWIGFSMLTDADGCGGCNVFPNATVGLVVAHLWHYNEDALAGGSFTLDVSAGKDSDTGTTTTDGISATALSEATNDDIGKEVVTTGFDAAGIVEAGNHFGVVVTKTSETAADDWRFNGMEVVVLVV